MNRFLLPFRTHKKECDPRPAPGGRWLRLGFAMAAAAVLAVSCNGPAITVLPRSLNQLNEAAAPAPRIDQPAQAGDEMVASPTAEPAVSADPQTTPTATAVPLAQPKPGAVTVVPILMYHYIRELPPNTPDKLGYGLSIAPKLFDAELAYLASQSYTSVSMDDVVRHMKSGTPLPAKPVVLSFDDGYADFYTAAWPLLQKYHFSATVYLVVDFLGKPGYMSWQQAQELKAAGVEIGAHTLDHVDLAKLSPAQARTQIAGSRTALQQRLSAPVDTFAYPSGQFNTETPKLVAEAGFSSAVTTAFGDKHTTDKLMIMPRVRVPGGIRLQDYAANLKA